MITAGQIRAARSLLGWNQKRLALEGGVATTTVNRMESGDGPVKATTDTLWKIQFALEAAGIEFINDAGGPGVRLKHRH